MRHTHARFWTIAALVLAPLPAFTEGAGRRSMPRGERLTPEQEAVADYNDAVELTEKADRAEAEAAAQADAARRDKLLRKARSQYEKAIRKLHEATERKPDLVPALGQLGYAYRKTGAFEDALKAYAQALALAPGYPPVIEYRAEAHLGLGRLRSLPAAVPRGPGARRQAGVRNAPLAGGTS
jgi:tetratricopeptide (TPR) repeat protein